MGVRRRGRVRAIVAVVAGTRRQSVGAARHRFPLALACVLVLAASAADATATRDARAAAGAAHLSAGSLAADAGGPHAGVGTTLTAEVRGSFLVAYRAGNPGAALHVCVIGPHVGGRQPP